MAEWKKSHIGQVLKEREGHYSPNDKKLAGLERLNKIDFSGEIHLSGKGSKTNMIIVEPGDLVISGINVAKGAIAVYHGDKSITATIHYSSYKFNKDQIDIEYFKRFVKSQAFIQVLEVRGGIKTEIKPKHFLPIEIDLPDINTQREIVSLFRRIEDEIGDLETEISIQSDYLAQLRLTVLHEAIEGKLTAEWRKQNPNLISGQNHASKLLEKIRAEKDRLIKEGKIRKEKPLPPTNDNEKPFALPDGWVWCRLIDVAQGFEYGSSTKSSKSGRVPVLRMGNIQNGVISWSKLVFSNDDDEISKYALRVDDLLKFRTQETGKQKESNREYAYFELDRTALSKAIKIDDEDKKELKNIYSAFEIDGALLGFFEDIGNYVKKGLLDHTMVYDSFDWYIGEIGSNEEIIKYINWQRSDGGDIHSGFEGIYRKLYPDNPKWNTYKK